ncbi:hypothetical protein APHAL10511_005635 [Amanita phalloides]|nr:hypothetical protein APHAL10511_005635 [Amanita phalloides]
MFPPGPNKLRPIQDLMSFFSIVRLAALGVLTASSFIVMATGAHILSLPANSHDRSFVGLAVAIPVLTFLTIVPSIIISLIRGPAPMHILIETVWLGVLWVLWLGAAADGAINYILLSADCIFDSFINGVLSCHEIQALQAFSWLNWLILSGYIPTFCVLCIIQFRKSQLVQPVQPVAYPDQQPMYPLQQQTNAPQPVYQQPIMQQMAPPQMQAPYAPMTGN